MLSTIKALSVRQPWAWLLVNNHKPLENRSWPTSLRGRLAIHASGTMSATEYDNARWSVDLVNECKRETPWPWEAPGTPMVRPPIVLPVRSEIELGGLVGSVEIYDCRLKDPKRQPEEISAWENSHQKYSWMSRNGRPSKLIPCKGSLRLWYLSTPQARQLLLGEARYGR